MASSLPDPSRKPLRVLMVITQYCPTVGGAERQAQAVSEGLVERGCEVIVLTQPVKGMPEEETEGGVRIVRRLKALALGPLWGLTFMRSANRELVRFQEQVDIIHCHQLYFHSAVAARRRPNGPPVICKALTAGAEGDLAKMSRHRGGERMLNWAKKMDRVIAICEPIAKEFIAAGFLPEQIERIPNMVDTRHFRPAAGFEEGEEWLFVGRLHPRKGLDGLLRAFGELPGARLAIAGQGPQRDELTALAGELNLGDRVRFLGKVEDPAPLYAKARGLILPSRGEGMSNVLLEALACGKFAIATDVGGARETFGPGEPLASGPNTAQFAWTRCGMLVRSAAAEDLSVALQAAESAPERRIACAMAGAKRVKSRFGREAVLDKLSKLYQDLLTLERK